MNRTSISIHQENGDMSPLKRATATILAIYISLFPAILHGATTFLEKSDSWTEFRFDISVKNGAFLETNSNLAFLQFDITLATAAYLQVTDAFMSGDRFEIYLNGVTLGLTSAPQSIGDDISSDYSLAFGKPLWSSREWRLRPGHYTISGYVTEMPQTRGRGALRVVDAPPVPIPSSAALMCLFIVAVLLLKTVQIQRLKKLLDHDWLKFGYINTLCLLGMIFTLSQSEPAEGAGLCTAKYARAAINARSYTDLCLCGSVSKSFVRHVLRHRSADVLFASMDRNCPQLSQVLRSSVENPSSDTPEPEGNNGIQGSFGIALGQGNNENNTDVETNGSLAEGENPGTIDNGW